MFEAQAKAEPRQQHRRVQVGQKLEGVVIQVGKDAVFVEIDGKHQAYVDAVELRAPDGTMTVKLGDRLAAVVVEADERTGQIRLARTLARGDAAGTAALEQARAAALPVEGKVLAINKGGLEIEVGGVRGFCPLSQTGTRTPEEAGALVGQVVRVLVTEVAEGGRRVIVSRRAVLDREAAEVEARLASELQVGAVVRGTVDRVESYGVFVQLEGTTGRAGRGLVPAAELGVARGTDLRKSFPPGTKVEAKVLEIGEGRLRLSVHGAKVNEERAHFEEAQRGKGGAPASLGTLGDLLKKRK